MNIKIGDEVLVTTNNFFYAPDGQQYRAVFGTVKALSDDKETLGISTNRHSTNWYIEVGNMLIAGCQVYYVIKTSYAMPNKHRHCGAEDVERSHIYFADE